MIWAESFKLLENGLKFMSMRKKNIYDYSPFQVGTYKMVYAEKIAIFKFLMK